LIRASVSALALFVSTLSLIDSNDLMAALTAARMVGVSPLSGMGGALGERRTRGRAKSTVNGRAISGPLH